MFTSNITDQKDQKIVDSFMGVDLKDYRCYKLQPNAVYSNYKKDQLHYIVDAMQKGNKLPSQIGLKRLKTKNSQRKLKRQQKNSVPSVNPGRRIRGQRQNNSVPSVPSVPSVSSVPQLKPKSPQQICLKALRTQFRNKLQENHVQAQKTKLITKSSTILKRKQNQRKRRNQLIRTVKQYRNELEPHFGKRLQGYGRCPKVSTKQIKEFLQSKGIEVVLLPPKPRQENFIPRGRRGRGMNSPIRQQRIPIVPPMMANIPGLSNLLQFGFPLLGGYPPMMGQPPTMGQPPMMGQLSSQRNQTQNSNTPIIDENDFPALI